MQQYGLGRYIFIRLNSASALFRLLSPANTDNSRAFLPICCLIRVFNKTLKSVLFGRRIAASGHCR